MREYIEAILIALLLALFIRTFVVQAFKIPSGSMQDTLLIGDHILVNKFIYGVKNPFSGNTWIPLKKPARRDIVVFKYPVNPSQDYIKRVVGVQGDTIQIKDKIFHVKILNCYRSITNIKISFSFRINRTEKSEQVF